MLSDLASVQLPTVMFALPYSFAVGNIAVESLTPKIDRTDEITFKPDTLILTYRRQGELSFRTATLFCFSKSVIEALHILFVDLFNV
jgi:hypothetical protein